jgi:4-diphosphocytidyl-2-C-methyl-D-erythritol kinase
MQKDSYHHSYPESTRQSYMSFMRKPNAGLLSELAPAKINLYLHVVGRRNDGYHLIDSLVVFSSISDEILVSVADKLSLSVSGPFASEVPTGESNLVLVAAKKLLETLKYEPKVVFHLTKILPVASGLGGGSSDAAATLRLLSKLYRIGMKKPEIINQLSTISQSLGADVPVCLLKQPCFVSGIGEKLSPAPSVTGIPILLVNPRLQVSTASVFMTYNDDFSAPVSFLAPTQIPLTAQVLADYIVNSHNDLTNTAIRLCPTIKNIINAISTMRGCLLARMSGSGGTCFGLFETNNQVITAAEKITKAEPSWWVQVGSLL